MQGLYDFKGSDVRFLTHAEEIWRNHPSLRTKKFVKCTMKTSYRITNQMCSFINDVLIGEERMRACRDGIKVQYIRNSTYNIQVVVCAEIMKLLESGVKPNEIFILGPSVKGQYSNIRRLENMLVEKNIPCHVPMLETTNIDERVINGKIVFSTFHTVKGRQRPYVFVVGFDNSYFKYYAKNLPRDICPNTIYVACTRATKGLYLLENNEKPDDRPLEFLHMNHVEMKQQYYIQFRGMHQTIFQDSEESNSRLVINLTPTEMIKFIPESILDDISNVLEKIFVREQLMKYELNMPTVIETRKGFYEEVSDLNGIAIPAMYYDFLLSAWNNTDASIMFDIINTNNENIGEIKNIFLKNILENLPKKLETISDYLYLSNIWLAIKESLYFKLKQIEPDEYNWLSEDMVMECKQRLKNIVGNDCQNEMPKIEEYIVYGSMDEQHVQIDQLLGPLFDGRKFRFTARVDIITENILWELKCTSEISNDHKLQLVIYAWLWNMRVNPDGFQNSDEKIFKIYNIKTNELLTLNATMDQLNYIVISILKGKYQKNKEKTLEEFLYDCEQAINKL
jgi:acyl carrier protein phosphodiesterase